MSKRDWLEELEASRIPSGERLGKLPVVTCTEVEWRHLLAIAKAARSWHDEDSAGTKPIEAALDAADSELGRDE